MSIFDKLSRMMRPEDDYEGEGYYLDDDYQDDDEYFDDYEVETPKLSFFSRNRAQESAPEKSQSRSSGFFTRKSDVLSVAPAAMQVSMKKPKNVNAFQDICDDLLDGKAVVINLEGVGVDVAQRIIDFTFGAVYSINGDLKEISKFIFIASPRTVELSGEFGEKLGFDEMPGSADTVSFGSERNALRKTSGFGY